MEGLWEVISNIISIVLIAGGVFFLTVGVIGLVRLPDVYTRLHATTKCDTMGAGMVLVGLAFQGDLISALKLVLIAVFIWVTNPTAAHVIAKASWTTGFMPVLGSKETQSKGGISVD